VRYDPVQLARVSDALARRFATASAPEPVDRWEFHPPTGHPRRLEFYLVTLLHQFAFWEARDGTYAGAWYGRVPEGTVRGSDFVWRRLHRALCERPAVFDLTPSACRRHSECDALQDLDGRHPPNWEAHRRMSTALRAALCERPLSARLASVRTAGTGAAFEAAFGDLPGYREDPLRKRLNLLFMYVTARADNPLGVPADARVAPAIDYHLQRILLRAGVVRARDASLRSCLTGRRLVTPAQELAVRRACYRAVAELVRRSGRTSFEVDQALFALRGVCGADADGPRCEECWIRRCCTREVALFQPLLANSVWY
jgi:hypothetical protein